jgi:peptide/nickel transport system ATP-binding protein
VLSPETKFLICDEITTMLDVITQAQIWQLLLEISEKRNLGMIIITHNMALAKQVCTRVIQLPEINHIEVDC